MTRCHWHNFCYGIWTLPRFLCMILFRTNVFVFVVGCRFSVLNSTKNGDQLLYPISWQIKIHGHGSKYTSFQQPQRHKQIHLLSAHLVVVVVLVALLVWSARVYALLMYARCHRCCKRLTHKPNHRLKANNCEMAMAPLVPLKPVLWGAVNYTCCGDFTKTKSNKLNWNPKKNNNKNQNGSNNNNTWTVTEQQ